MLAHLSKETVMKEKLSLLSVSKEDIGRVLLHVPVGLIAGFMYFAHWSFPVIFIAAFLVYEKNQDKYVHDQAWKDIKGAIWGMGIAGVTIGILQLLGG